MKRVGAIIILFMILVAGCVGFGVQYNGSEAYLNSNEITTNYSDYIGESIHIWGKVVAEQSGRVIIKTGSLRLEVTDLPTSDVQPGDSIQVYGEVQADRKLTTISYHTQSPTDKQYMYIVSIFGVIIAVISFLQRWRVSITNIHFVPREGTLSVGETYNRTRLDKLRENNTNTISQTSGDSDTGNESESESERDG
jgi:hypothetical protein